MNSPSPKPDDDTPSPQPLPREGAEQPAAGRPPSPPNNLPARDPLLDDPLFAELLESRPGPDLSLTGSTNDTAAPPQLEVMATETATGPGQGSAERVRVPHGQESAIEPPPDEPPTAGGGVPAPESLPVARPVEPPIDPAALPRARPVRPRATPLSSASSVPSGTDRPAPPSPHEAGAGARVRTRNGDRRSGSQPEPPPARPRVLAACGVIGCFGLVFLAAVGFLAYAAIFLLSHIEERMAADRDHLTKPAFAPTHVGPITPTKLTADEGTIPLPDACDAVGRGARGRYLLFRIPSSTPSKRQLVVFDPVEAKLVQHMLLDHPATQFAASASKLFLWNPRTHTIDRYDLGTLQKEQTSQATFDDTPHALVTGYATDGPVFVVTAKFRRGLINASFDAAVVDPKTLQTVTTIPLGDWPNQVEQANHYRVSGDGTVVGRSTLGLATASKSAAVLRYEPTERFKPVALPAQAGEWFGHVTPSPNGRFLYTARGAFHLNEDRVTEAVGQPLYTLPTAHGSDLFLSLPGTQARKPAARPLQLLSGPLKLHLAGVASPAAPLGEVQVPTGIDAWDTNPLPADQRIHLWPAAGLLAVLPSSNDKLLLYRRDIGSLLKNSLGDHDYLVIGSDPPTTARRGEEWKYTPAVWASGNRPVGVEVVSPQKVMRVRGGEIVWTPSERSPKTVGVHIQVTNPDTGQKAEQKFKLTVADPAEEDGAASD